MLEEPALLLEFVRMLSDMEMGVAGELRGILGQAVKQRVQEGPSGWDAARFSGLGELAHLGIHAEETYVGSEVREELMSKLEERVGQVNRGLSI